MNIEIIDNLKILTKHQKMKIKEKYRKNENNENILKSIHYKDDNTDKRYNKMNIKKKENNNIEIEFLYEDENKKMLKNKLKNRLNHLKNRNRPDWVMYEKLKAHFKDMIPSPDVVIKEKDKYNILFDKFNDTNPIVKYFHLCLQYE